MQESPCLQPKAKSGCDPRVRHIWLLMPGVVDLGKKIAKYSFPIICKIQRASFVTIMFTTPNLNLWTISFTPKTYKEESEGRGTEPKKRWLTFTLYSLDRKWHVKLTFQGNLRSAQNNTFAKVTKRRKDLENLCLCIDFDFIQLLDNTVTENRFH